MREAPTPNYEYDVKQIIQTFENALAELERELNDLFLSDFERAQIIITQDNIRAIIEQLENDAIVWTESAMTKSVTEGIANTLFTLYLAETMEQARQMVQLSELNDFLLKAVIADTQTDLLAVTQNVSRRVRNVIRKNTGKVLRRNLTQGINSTQSLKSDLVKEWRKDLREALDTGLIDVAGRRWRPSTYAGTVVRTKMMNAHIEASTNEALERNAFYGIISRHNATDACRYHEGRIVKLTPDAPGDYPTVEELRESKQIFHPNCRHNITVIKDLNILSDSRKQFAEQQAEIGKRAIATGKRNPDIV